MNKKTICVLLLIMLIITGCSSEASKESISKYIVIDEEYIENKLTPYLESSEYKISKGKSSILYGKRDDGHSFEFVGKKCDKITGVKISMPLSEINNDMDNELTANILMGINCDEGNFSNKVLKLLRLFKNRYVKEGDLKRKFPSVIVNGKYVLIDSKDMLLNILVKPNAAADEEISDYDAVMNELFDGNNVGTSNKKTTEDMVLKLYKEKRDLKGYNDIRIEISGDKILDNKIYDVYHIFEFVKDDKNKGLAHYVTIAWVYLDNNGKKMYELNVAENKLIPLN